MAIGKDAQAVKVGPGLLYIAPLETPEPTDLSSPLDEGWIPLGYTDEGTEFTLGTESENVEVAEELDPVAVITTSRVATAAFALAQMTARNLQYALNGGDILADTGWVQFEPPELGEEGYWMLVWEDDPGAPNNRERWLFRRVRNTAESAIPRRKGAEKAVIPVTFTAFKPFDAGLKTWSAWFDESLSGDEENGG